MELIIHHVWIRHEALRVECKRHFSNFFFNIIPKELGASYNVTQCSSEEWKLVCV